MSHIMSDSHEPRAVPSGSLVDKIFELLKQLNDMNEKYDTLKERYTTEVQKNYTWKNTVDSLQKEVRRLEKMGFEREHYFSARHRRLESQYNTLHLRYAKLKDDYYKADHGDYGFGLTGDVKTEAR